MSLNTLETHEEGKKTFILERPEHISTPLIFASPHSGRKYTHEFVSACAADPMDIRRIEDAYMDVLVRDVTQIGAPFLHALIGRACLDLNRAANELDKNLIDPPLQTIWPNRTPRVQAGLGCIPRIAHKGVSIYGRKLLPEDVEHRLETIYHPYHNALSDLVDNARREWGMTVLIDCHSMPEGQYGGNPLPDFILGDRFGASCGGALTDKLEAILLSRGYTVHRNTPYAGGYTTNLHGRPEKQRHAIQIEINRNLYLDQTHVKLLDKADAFQKSLLDVFQDMDAWVKTIMEKGKFDLKPSRT
jgi:N-formylglutamate amidohydrolase